MRAGHVWTEVKNALIVRFQDENIEDRVNAALKAIRQGPQETVKEYLSRFRELLARLGEATEHAWYRSWVDGLRPHLREAVRSTGYTSLSDAADIAARKESTAGDLDISTISGPKATRPEIGVEVLEALGEWALHARGTRGRARHAHAPGPEPNQGVPNRFAMRER